MDKWISVKDQLPLSSHENELVALARTFDGSFYGYSVARYISCEDGSHWCDDKYGYLEWDKYSDGRGGSSRFRVIAWMPIPVYDRW